MSLFRRSPSDGSAPRAEVAAAGAAAPREAERSVHYHGDVYQMPDWAGRRARERELGRAHARREGGPHLEGHIDAITLRTGRVPRFRELEAEQAAELDRVEDCLHEEQRRAEAAEAAHAVVVEEAEKNLAATRRELDQVDEELEELVLPSRRPGDGRAGSIAVSDDRWGAVRRWAVPVLALVLILMVEIPIFYQVILSWGDTPEFTALLAFGVAMVMLVGPHMYGRALRAWQESGGPPTGRWVFIAIAAGWLILIVSVAVLRREALVRPIMVDGENLGVIGDEVGQVPTMILLLALLIATGFISAELGRRLYNPNDKRLRQLRRRRDELGGRTEELVAEVRRARGLERSIEGYVDGVDARRRARVEQVKKGFHSLESAYLDGVLEGLADPEAASWADMILEVRRLPGRTAI